MVALKCWFACETNPVSRVFRWQRTDRYAALFPCGKTLLTLIDSYDCVCVCWSVCVCVQATEFSTPAASITRSVKSFISPWLAWPPQTTFNQYLCVCVWVRGPAFIYCIVINNKYYFLSACFSLSLSFLKCHDFLCRWFISDMTRSYKCNHNFDRCTSQWRWKMGGFFFPPFSSFFRFTLCLFFLMDVSIYFFFFYPSSFLLTHYLPFCAIFFSFIWVYSLLCTTA